MKTLTLIFVPTTAMVVGLVLLLNALDAGVGVSVAALGLTAGVSGAAIGYFSDRLPDIPRPRSGSSTVTHRSRR
jgi:hypothetical protein